MDFGALTCVLEAAIHGSFADRSFGDVEAVTTLLESVEATSLPRFLALVTVEWVALEVLMPLHGLGGI